MKKAILYFVMMFPLVSTAQEKPEIIDEINGRDLIKQNDKYGLMKKSKYVIPAYFDTVYYIDDDYFMVHQNGKMGVFDIKGKMIVPVAYQNINPYLPAAEIFEVFATGIRSVFITPKHNKLYGGVIGANTLIVKQTEVSVLDWLCFMKDVSENGDMYGFTIDQILPDTTRMDPNALKAYRYYVNQSSKSTHRERCLFGYKYTELKDLYFDERIADDKIAKTALEYPITGITYEQANKYCRWLTIYHEVNEDFYLDELKVEFRLPKVAEWEQMAYDGLNETMKSKKAMDSVNVKGCAMFNYHVTTKCSNYEDLVKHYVGTGLCERTSFFPNKLGLYCLFGNAAEMVYENTIAKGGAYCHYAKDSDIESNIIYEGAQPWLGFRYVMEIKIKN